MTLPTLSRDYPHLNRVKRIVAIGGGHGLGRVMSALGFMQGRLTGIVTTTDNGGSTGRLRQSGGIAWGDLRNCLNQIVTKPTTASALFEHRFADAGELSGHNLGNLMLKALESMAIRPVEAINLVRKMLHIKSRLLPMSESPVHLAAGLGAGSSIVGETDIDNLPCLPQSVFLVPLVAATPEAVNAVKRAEVILLGPGSFFTSILPPLLLPEMIHALQHSRAKTVFIDNLGVEHSPAAALSLQDRINWIHQTLGTEFIDAAITPHATDRQNAAKTDRTFILQKRLNADDISYRHDRHLLSLAIDEVLGKI